MATIANSAARFISWQLMNGAIEFGIIHVGTRDCLPVDCQDRGGEAMKNFIKPALVLVVLFALCGCSGGQRNEDDLQPPLASPVASGMNYVDVATQFEKAGFSNVQLEGNGELVVGLFHREGDVDEVSIDGKIDYATGDWFPKNSTVIIRFYSFEKASGTLSELQEAEKRKSEQAEKEAAEKERLQAEEEERKAAELAEAEKKAKAEEAEAQAKAQAEEEERKAAEEAKKAEEEKLASYVDQPLRDVYKSLLAEGKKQSAITIAEGEKQARILEAEAAKQQAILAAEAEKESQILEAQGEAEAIRNVQQATADGIRMVREAGADSAVLTLQSFEAMKKVADGQATKLIIPSDMQGLAGIAASLKEIVTDDKDEEYILVEK